MGAFAVFGFLACVVCFVTRGLEAAVAAVPATEADLIYLFHRPPEPVFTLRGVNRDVAFDVPVEYLPERYKDKTAVIAAMAAKASRLIAVKLMDFSAAERDFADIAQALPDSTGKFSRGAPPHLQYTVRLQHFLQESNTTEDILAKAVWLRLHLETHLVLDAIRTTLTRRQGAQQGVQLFELPQYMPEMFVDDRFFAKMREEMYVVPDGERLSIQVIRNETQRNTDESKVWYWLEDPHLNVYHWHWHINYPPGYDDDEFVDRDRRGEMFTYIHRQMLARYNAERLANGVAPALPLDWHEPIPDAFFPKFLDVHQSSGYAGRQANTSLLEKAIADLDVWHERYRKVLAQKYVVTPEGQQIPVTGLKGLDIVANLLESNALLSPNVNFYGNIHGQLHFSLGLAQDPNGDNYAPFSTIALLSMARDPIFYRLHTHTDDLYEAYKQALMQPYEESELAWPDVSVVSVSTRSSGADNELHTHWQESDLDVSLGLDYTPTGRVYARFTHLQHDNFTYEIQVLNKGTDEKSAFVRVFLLVTEDEKGQPVDLAYQQRYAMEMDRFQATLEPGLNEISRDSRLSTLTIDQDSVYTTQTTLWEARRANQCRCGFPQTLLVPRGTADGLRYVLFAMVTDFAQDSPPASPDEICHDGWLLCGVPGSTFYPDKRAMAFPFDRQYRPEVKTLADFLTDNMAVQDVVIRFNDSRVDPPTALLPGGMSTSWMP